MAVKVNDRVFEELRAQVDKAGGTLIKVGVLQAEGSVTTSDGETTLAELAAIHEFGAPRANIPARSFLLRTFSEDPGRGALMREMARLGRAVASGKIDIWQSFERLGTWGVATVKNRIKAHIPPPNSPDTIKHKGSSTPLVDTGQLINSITYEVKGEIE
jgi:phage gpG-like protein